MAKITVLLPHFNSEAYLYRAAASVLAQTERDLELCVIDDCSGDDTWRKVLAPLGGDARLKLFRTSQRVGPYRIKNALIAACDSPFIAFQDSDDASLPKRLQMQLACMAAHGAGLVGSSAILTDAGGRANGVRIMPPSANWFLQRGKSYASLHPTALVKREVFDAIGCFDGTTTIGADSDFLFRAAYRFQIRNVLRPLYLYCQRTNSLTASAATGHGSPLRTSYWAWVKERESERRAAFRAGVAVPLAAPDNDLLFDVVRVG